MYRLSSTAAGSLAMLGALSLAVSGAVSLALVSSSLISSALMSPETRTGDQVERAHKGDLLVSTRSDTRSDTQDQAQVSTVEVVGVRDTAIIYRDRDGRILFRTDPLANVTVVAKGLTLPAVTVREHSEAIPQPMPVQPAQQDGKDQPPQDGKDKWLEGCDPLVSPLAKSSLSKVAGRCIAGLATGEKVAMLRR